MKFYIIKVILEINIYFLYNIHIPYYIPIQLLFTILIFLNHLIAKY